MTQQDQHSENGAGRERVGEGQRPDDVTREQGGQFMEESDELTHLPLDAIEAQADARIDRGAVDTVNALQVTMDRSGAEHIHAQRVAMTNSGAKSIESRSTKLNQSAAITIASDKADLRQSSSLVVSGDEMNLDHSTAFIAASGKATFGDENRIGLLAVGDLEASGNVRAFMMLGGNVNARDGVQTTLTTASAAALGAGFGVIWFLLRRLLGPRD